ncbi:MAG: TetR/AcrR family transcriptional regulator [Actinomycetia bacterium]|nr:TetR/AcrR family transcriptional regulator [Actinomycetes bacterium]MCP4962338.1 TetR/AcrR family transcriptional regulator [Actinomycetes bacterium]
MTVTTTRDPRVVIVEAATELFSRRGVDGVSIADIASEVGMSKANVLHHHRTKEDLYKAALLGVGESLQNCVALAGTGRSASRRLESEIRAWGKDRPSEVRLLTYGLLRLTDHPGRWVLEESVAAMVAVMDGADQPARMANLIAVLGEVTYETLIDPLAGRLADLKKQ